MTWGQSNHTFDPRTYEGMEGTVIIDGSVAALPYCPSGKCWMTHKGGRRERVRLHRETLKGAREFRLVCRRCRKTWMGWA